MTACERCDGQGEVFDRKDFWGNDLTVQCPECSDPWLWCSRCQRWHSLALACWKVSHA